MVSKHFTFHLVNPKLILLPSHLVENKPKKELIRMLQKMGYDSDPVKAWKQAQEKVGPFLKKYLAEATGPTKLYFYSIWVFFFLE